MWGLDFDKAQFVNGIIFDVILAAILTYISFLVGVFWERGKSRKKFSRMVGKYSGHYVGEQGVIDPEPISTAEIRYLSDNHLWITLEHPPEGPSAMWEGDITMEMETFGVVCWRYTRFFDEKQDPQKTPWYGFKRIMVREFKDEVHVYLIGDKAEGFGNEILIRKR